MNATQTPILAKPQPPLHLGCVTTQNYLNWIQFPGTFNNQMCRSAQVACDNLTSISLLYANNFNGGSHETSTGETATLTASIEYPSGVLHAIVTWAASQTVTQAAGGFDWSDFISVNIPDGATFWIRTYRTSPTVSGGTILQSGRCSSDHTAAADEWVDEGTPGAPVADTTQTLAAPAVKHRWTYGPSSIIGWTRKRSVICLGDSRVRGPSSWPGYLINETGELCPIFALNNIPYMNGGMGGDTLENLATTKVGIDTRMEMAKYATDIAITMGINDCSAGATVAQMVANINKIFRNIVTASFVNIAGIPQVGVAGMPQRTPTYAVGTLSPHTSSTDAWATTGNQTPTGNPTNIVGLNASIRGQDPSNQVVCTICNDFALRTAYSGDPQLWPAPSNTADGLHGLAVNNQLILTPPVIDPNFYRN